jgi:hypothetical protein
MEKQKFEHQWRDAFQGSEISPSENVWTNIELDLEKDESTGIKRKLVFYKMLAAASVIFAMAVGATGIYFFNGNGSANLQQIASVQKNSQNAPEQLSAEASSGTSLESSVITEAQATDDQSTDRTSDDTQQSSVKRSALPASIAKTNQTEEIVTDNARVIAVVLASESKDVAEENRLSFDVNTKNLPSITSVPKVAFKMPEAKKEEVADPVALMLAKMDARENQIKSDEKKKKSNEEDLWTSVGFAAGSFNSTGSSVSPTASNQAIQSNNNIATKEADASGYAYTVGVNMGKKLSDRWVLQGGVNYLAQSSDYTAQTAVGNVSFQAFRPESINELDKLNEGDVRAADSRVVNTAPYNVNNDVRYLSVPLQAGYLLMDKKFGFQLNAGVSTDLFLQNTKTADGRDVAKIDQGPGDDSPYRPMNFSGLFGTELSYKFSPRYRVTLNPGLRYPLNSIYKSDLGVQSAPITFDVGLRFRYIFH